MTEVAISVEHLSKCFKIYQSPRDRIKQIVYPLIQRMLGKQPSKYYRDFWALKNISFEIKKGETVGIVGRNGSGKSTLLQLITGTLTPTEGTIKTYGRVAALLELGTGFNPEFTGRENVYMNAAVLGLSHSEIDAKYEAILEFADIGDFIDQPVKTYSSGMMVRLAFSVAINVDPEILIVDEALSVGDELFQRKCFSRIEAIRASGATILFVSHAGSQIIQLCDYAILLDAGELLMVNEPRKTVGFYHKLISSPVEKREDVRYEIKLQEQYTFVAKEKLKQSLHLGDDLNNPNKLQHYYDPNLKPQSTIAYESLGATISSAKVLTLDGDRVNNLEQGKSYRYVYTVDFQKDSLNVRFGMLIKTVSGMELGGGMTTVSLDDNTELIHAGTKLNVEFTFKCALNPGLYFLNAGVLASLSGEDKHIHRLLDVELFRVMPNSNSISVGTINFDCWASLNLISRDL